MKEMNNYSITDLLEAATKARGKAYAPYSGFHVGAALLTFNGRIFTGCNVENASYGLSICAERAAVFSAVCSGQKDFCAIAIVGDGDDFCFPCGACRQVLAEFNPEMDIILSDNKGNNKVIALSILLPALFTFKPGGKQD